MEFSWNGVWALGEFAGRRGHYSDALVEPLQRYDWRIGRRVLDVGCGRVPLSDHLVRPGRERTLIDLDPGVRALPCRDEPIRIAGDVAEARLEGPYDAAILSCILNYVDSPRVLARVREAMAPFAPVFIANRAHLGFTALFHDARPASHAALERMVLEAGLTMLENDGQEVIIAMRYA